MAQFGRAPALGAGCRRFKSCHPDHYILKGCIIMTDLMRKKRKEFQVVNTMRISYSLNDIMIEDFIDQTEHPYTIYDLEGNVLEANVAVDTFKIDYEKSIDFLKYIIGKYGME